MKYTIPRDELVVLNEFLAESKEHLQGIEDKVLKLEVSKDNELVNSIFRPIHTIKGSSSFLGLDDIRSLSHEVETLLDDIRKERITEISSGIIDVLLESIDVISKMIKSTASTLEAVDTKEEEIYADIPDIPYQEILNQVIQIRNDKIDEEGIDEEESDEEESDPMVEQLAAAVKASGKSPRKSKKKRKGKKKSSTVDYDNLKINYPGDMKLQYEIESSEQLALVEKTLLALENSPKDFLLYNDLFRALHSLKGNTGVILSVIDNEEVRSNHFLNHFKDIAHLSESLIQRKRDVKKTLNDAEIDLLLNGTDCMKNHLNSFKLNKHPQKGDCPVLHGKPCNRGFVISTESGIQVPENTCPLIFHLENVTSNAVGEIAPRAGQLKDIGGDSLAEAITNSLSQSLDAVEQGLIDVTDDEKRTNALKKLKRGYKNLIKIGKKINHDYLVLKADGALKLIQFMTTEQNPEEELFIANMKQEFKELKAKADRRKEAETIDRRRSTIPPPTEDITQDVETRISDKVLKVSQEKIDVFMNLIGELLVSKNSLNAFEKEVASNYDLPEIVDRLKLTAHTIARISNDLQTNIMEIRMLPVANAFSRFPRMVRDLSKKLNKKIKLSISGEDTEIDKSIIEALADPLVHMVRNSADHGIELPAQRVEQGKPEEGVISLSAFNQGQFVVIRLSDDGKGMDPEKIKQKAMERGLIPPEELEVMDDKQVFNLIFIPGFSMATEVSDVSGRGVGMDVVKTNIEKLGGETIVESTLGKGSDFTIKLPLTMAIGRGLEVESRRNRYYIPLEAIRETLRVSPENLFQYKGREMTVLRDQLIPVYRLDERLGLETNGRAVSKSTKEALVILDVKGRKLGLLVDNYYNESEYVIKPLTDAIAHIEGISGAMITGQGKVHLILDLLRLF